jgi:hypothetical protein
VLPRFGLDIEFLTKPMGGGVVAIEGHLRLAPTHPWSRFLLFRVLRRRSELGRIRYVARPVSVGEP